MDKLRIRFITFNMIIISTIVTFIAALIYLGSPSQIPIMRLLIIIVIMLGLVWIGSFLLSKIAMKPIQASWQRQLDFTADASHELRTPLAVMRTNVELVMDNPDETVDSQMKWLNNIHTETIRMTRLVDDLLILSRGDAGAKTLEYSYFSLNSVAEEAITLFETAANEKQIVMQVISDNKIQFLGDYSRIKQLLCILIDNAIKYMGRSGNINITLSKRDKTVQMDVWDTGIGIASEHLSKIFNRFYRKGSEKQAIDGFGLGLSIAKWIVLEHGGIIRAESTIGEGTHFIIYFPLSGE